MKVNYPAFIIRVRKCDLGLVFIWKKGKRTINLQKDIGLCPSGYIEVHAQWPKDGPLLLRCPAHPLFVNGLHWRLSRLWKTRKECVAWLNKNATPRVWRAQKVQGKIRCSYKPNNIITAVQR